MIKRILQYFRKRSDMRLRKWCVKLAVDVKSGNIEFSVGSTANEIYQWVKGLPESKP